MEIEIRVFSLAVSCKIPSSTGTSHKKPYDPMQFTEKSDNNSALKEAHHKLKLLEFDYKALHDKRLQDVSGHWVEERTRRRRSCH